MTTKKGKSETTPKANSDQNLLKKTSSQILYPIIINILFIIGGLLFLSRILQGTQVLDIVLAPVGIVLIFFTTMTEPIATEKDMHNILAFSIWVIASYIITIRADSEILFILIFVGFLIILEFSHKQITQRFQKRLNIVLVFFLMIFFVIVADKIYIILIS
jgi:hypothetical protein